MLFTFYLFTSKKMWRSARFLRCAVFSPPKFQNFGSIASVKSKTYSISCKKFNFSLPFFSDSRFCSNQAYEHTTGDHSQPLGKIQPKLFLAFTCKKCKARIEKYISKIAYTKGVVIVRCDGCEENHLIADNLGWFPNLKSMRNIEEIMASKGEKVKKSLDDYEIKEKDKES